MYPPTAKTRPPQRYALRGMALNKPGIGIMFPPLFRLRGGLQQGALGLTLLVGVLPFLAEVKVRAEYPTHLERYGIREHRQPPLNYMAFVMVGVEGIEPP